MRRPEVFRRGNVSGCTEVLDELSGAAARRFMCPDTDEADDGRVVPVYAVVYLVLSSPQMSLVLEDAHGIRGLLLRARASDYRFALSSPGQLKGHGPGLFH